MTQKVDREYGLHPSPILRRLFEARPFQGAEPSKATFLFFGLDANFAKDIEGSGIFPYICDYLHDGVGFWQRKKVHHPFLLESYPVRGSGRKYHERFRQIGFQPENASQVSFVEVLDIPTHGSGCPPLKLLRPEHMRRLEEWVKDGNARYIFMPSSVIALLHRKKAFLWVSSEPVSEKRSLPILHQSIGKAIFSPYHLSYRFAPPDVLERQLADIRALIADG